MRITSSCGKNHLISFAGVNFADCVICSVLTEQVATHCQKVKKLEAYLGGEIPTVVSEEDGGRTWKEEREFLYSETQVHRDTGWVDEVG